MTRPRCAVCGHRSGWRPVPDETTILKFRHLLKSTAWPSDFAEVNASEGARNEVAHGHDRRCHHHQRADLDKNKLEQRDPDMRRRRRATSGISA